MVKKNNAAIAPWVLFFISAAMLSGGWLMKSFPLLIFFGFAPLFAIVDQTKQEHSFWTNIEFILLALFVSFFAANGFEGHSIIKSIVQAIIFAMAFWDTHSPINNLVSDWGNLLFCFFGLDWNTYCLNFLGEVTASFFLK
jgi:hypothetical protein